MTASTQAYQGLLHSKDIHLFAAELQQLQPRLNEACHAMEMSVILEALLLMMEKLKLPL